jgi:hypothetical protein
MTAVSRLQRLLIVAALALAACDGDGGNVAQPSVTASPTVLPSPTPSDSPSAAPTPSPSPTPEPRPIPPAWAAPIDDDLGASDLPSEALVPPDAQLSDRVTLPAGGDAPDQVAVTYVIGDDPFAAEHGFALWQRFEDRPHWSVVLAFVDAATSGVLGIRVAAGDATGDGHDDVLTFEETGGSGACGTWRVIATEEDDTREVLRRKTCDAEFVISPGALELRTAVYEPNDAHCCPSAFRYTTFAWNGEAFERTDVVVEPT